MPPDELTDAQWDSLAQRLESNTDRSAGPDGCWPYLKLVHRKVGYGRIQLGPSFVTQASRAAYMLLTRTLLPASVCVLHRCDNRKCCNPAHLFTGSVADNQHDMKAKGRSNRGERNGNAKLVPEQVREIRRLAAAGASDLQIATRFSIGRAAVLKIRRRQRWQHL